MLTDIDEEAPLNIERVGTLDSPKHRNFSSRVCGFSNSSSSSSFPPPANESFGPACNVKEIGPLTILLVRHGESAGNVDPTIYERVPDHAIPLTERGKEMSIKAGQLCRQFIEENCNNSLVKLWVSPFLRTRQTAECMLRDTGLAGHVTDIVETPLLVEQDWGVFEGAGNRRDPAQQMDSYLSQVGVRARRMKRFGGSFYARWPMGESCFDVCLRTEQLFPRILNEWKGSATRKRRKFAKRAPIRTVIIVSHGVTIRAFTLMWCQYPPEYIDVAPNPPNCSIGLLTCAQKNWNGGFIFGGFDRMGDEVDIANLVPRKSSRLMSSFCDAHSRDVKRQSCEIDCVYGQRVADNYRELVRELTWLNRDFYAADFAPVHKVRRMLSNFNLDRFRNSAVPWWNSQIDCITLLGLASMITTTGALVFLAARRFSRS
eukprot:GEMP01060886.1.p1 GENE.GEMP01060886.1~~GEMP01060886.1.p1  ORF type:complete len:430 (+),score=62.51 GEMP01060886.1:25-1314(+)